MSGLGGPQEGQSSRLSSDWWETTSHTFLPRELGILMVLVGSYSWLTLGITVGQKGKGGSLHL